MKFNVLIMTFTLCFTKNLFAWTESSSVDKMTDKKNKYILLESFTTGHGNDKVRLYIDCKKSGDIQFQSSDMFNSNLNGLTDVTFRFDKNKKSDMQGFNGSSNKSVTIFNSNKGYWAFKKQISKGTILLIRFKSIMRDYVDHEFTVSGFDEAMKSCTKNK